MNMPEGYVLSVRNAEKNRERNMLSIPELLGDREKEELIKKHHPEYNDSLYNAIPFGKSAGMRVNRELCALLIEGYRGDNINPSSPMPKTDILVIGGGGAGALAALAAKKRGMRVLLVTKLRLGDSNTVMAEGGMQVPLGKNDSPDKMFADAMKGGRNRSDAELLQILARSARDSERMLERLGTAFDRDENGHLKTVRGGGTCESRIIHSGDRTGLELMRVLCDEIRAQGIETLEYTALLELLLDTEGCAAGALLEDTLEKKVFPIRAGAVIIATGGCGSLGFGGFPTTNFSGSTADGLAAAYRAGAELVDADSIQYHPTSLAFPKGHAGALITEKARSLGAALVNRNGDAFVNPLETRDAVTSAILREIAEGRGSGSGISGFVLLDTPMIDLKNGKGTVETELPNLFGFMRELGTDIRTEPIPVFPAIHYQNGGLKIDGSCMTAVRGLFAAGEAVGGIHGRNRLMGNSLTDIAVFGNRAGEFASDYSETKKDLPLTLSHLA